MMPAGRDGPASAPVVQIDGFEGPLDFLLELARAQKVDLGRLSIVALVDQYVAAVEAPGARATLAERGEWLIAASWLVLLKSKLLVQADEEEVPEAERLRDSLNRAEQRRQARALAGWLERQPQLGQEVFARGAVEAQHDMEGTGGGDLLDLLLACSDLLDLPARPTQEVGQPYTPPVLDVCTLTEAILHLRAWLRDHPDGGELGDLLPRAADAVCSSPLRRRSSLASGFLAGLELAKQGEALIWQAQAFGPVQVVLPPRAPSP
ncbi:segregation and condensation protein A [Roseomonas mucosa]|uniref:segregation and condensation protein A n=1 Tax=Roseomonas mucosa TaxID=207340 RepID=UPI0028CC6318|nr:segregation/condensation protein A [Roseomonas mucosa]MDT8351021.1 segregation/condensation protein A [Roseomonas mucosa]